MEPGGYASASSSWRSISRTSWNHPGAVTRSFFVNVAHFQSLGQYTEGTPLAEADGRPARLSAEVLFSSDRFESSKSGVTDSIE